MIVNKELKKRILEISYKKKLSHLGSCLTAVDIIDEIFKIKKPDEKFVLSSGHAALALYVVLEKYLKNTVDTCVSHRAEYLFDKHGVHPNRDRHIDCSTGSLGHGIGIAVGMALADRKNNVYCLISDGECSEGSVWEALRIWRRENLSNLKIYLNFNEYSAYNKTYLGEMPQVTKTYITNFKDFPFLGEQLAHYKVMNENDYKQAMEILK